MCWWRVLYDIGINLCSNVVFAGGLWLLLRYLYRRELNEAKEFFGFVKQTQIKMYVSAHEDKHTVSKSVVTQVEYEAAVEVKNTLRDLSGRELIRKIAGVIGQDPKLPEPTIEVSSLEEIEEPPRNESLILIGGPLRNQLTKFYLGKEPLLKFDSDGSKYLEKVEGRYQEINDPSIVAILVKMILENQVVFLVFGNGEEHTRNAASYLAKSWRKLNKKYPRQSFGICMSIEEGSAREMKVILNSGKAR